MPMVKVWNDNVYDFKQTLKGEDFLVPAKGFIEMEYEEAIDFKGAFSPMPPEDFSGDHALYYKMIRVEAPPPGSVFRDEGLTNHLTGQKATTPGELAETLAAVRHLVMKDPEADKVTQSDERVARLEAELEELRNLIKGGATLKQKPGPKRKEA